MKTLLGAVLPHLRKARGLPTAASLAESSSVHKSIISRIEAGGQRGAGEAVISSIARALLVQPRDLAYIATYNADGASEEEVLLVVDALRSGKFPFMKLFLAERQVRVLVSLVAVRRNRILLVQEGHLWTLPGGTPKGRESDLSCLLGALQSMPCIDRASLKPLGIWLGEPPYVQGTTECRAYWGDILQEAPLRGTSLKYAEEALTLNLCEISRLIIRNLAFSGLLR